MNKKTMIAAMACGIAVFAANADLASDFEKAYKAGDLQFIATNNYGFQKWHKNVQPKDYPSFSDAYLAVGKWITAEQYADAAKDNGRWAAAMNVGLEKNFVNYLTDNGRLHIAFNDKALVMPENIGLFKAIMDLTVECANDPAKAAKAG